MDRLEAIERLAKLRDTGVLSESEYLQQKSLVMSATSIVPRAAPVEVVSNILRKIDSDDPAAAYRGSGDIAPQIHIHNTNMQHVPAPGYYARPEKSVAVAYLLWLLFGGFGGHRFYLGKPGTAITIFLMNVVGWATLILGIGFIFLGAAALWLFIDIFLIPSMVGERNRMVAG